MKVKSWLKYFIYIILILVIVCLGQYIFGYIKKNSQETFNINPYLIFVINIIFYGVIGVLLGLEHLICEIDKEGTWKINLPKIVLMVIPSLYFSFAFIIYYSNNLFVQNVLSYPLGVLLRNGNNFIPAFQLMLGYSLTTSFCKKNKKYE